MEKQAKTITLDKDLVEFLEKDAEEQHLEFSSRLNQILHKYMEEQKVNKPKNISKVKL